MYSPSRAEMDVTDFESIENAISGFRPNILINNAGYVMPQSIKNADLACTKKHIDINIGGTFYCTAVALKYNPNLEIINLGSAASVRYMQHGASIALQKRLLLWLQSAGLKMGLYAVLYFSSKNRTKMRKIYFQMNQSTLLEPSDFAEVIMKAVRMEYESGTHIVVRKQDVVQLLAKG